MKGRFEIPASKRTIYIFIIVWLIAVVIISGFRPISMLVGSWETSTSTRYGFSIDHPKWWVAREHSGYKNDDTVVYIISSNFDPGFNGIRISQKKISHPSTWDVAEWGMSLRQQSGWRLNERQDADLIQTPLRSIEVSGQTVLQRTFRSEDFVDEDIYIARANDMTIITLRTSNGQYEKYLDEFDRVWGSFTPLE
jgi:hypothetical protein